jgi:hypothetical protein
MYVDRQVARRGRSRSRSNQLRNYRLLSLLLGIIAVAAIMAWAVVLAKLDLAETRAHELDAELNRASRDLADLRAQLDERERDLVALVENRVPGMQALEYNKLLDIHQGYVLNISFAEAGVGETKQLEYHAMLRNDSTSIVEPKVTVYLFDEYGLEVGAATLEKDDATQDYALAELRPGETRSYHEPIAIKRGAAPAYYMVHVE